MLLGCLFLLAVGLVKRKGFGIVQIVLFRDIAQLCHFLRCLTSEFHGKFHPKNWYRMNHEGMSKGHPTSKLSPKPLRDISKLLAMYNDCLKRSFYHLEKFDLFEYLSWKLKYLKIYRMIFSSWTLPSKNLQTNHLLFETSRWPFWVTKIAKTSLPKT